VDNEKDKLWGGFNLAYKEGVFLLDDLQIAVVGRGGYASYDMKYRSRDLQNGSRTFHGGCVDIFESSLMGLSLSVLVGCSENWTRYSLRRGGEVVRCGLVRAKLGFKKNGMLLSRRLMEGLPVSSEKKMSNTTETPLSEPGQNMKKRKRRSIIVVIMIFQITTIITNQVLILSEETTDTTITTTDRRAMRRTSHLPVSELILMLTMNIMVKVHFRLKNVRFSGTKELGTTPSCAFMMMDEDYVAYAYIRQSFCTVF